MITDFERAREMLISKLCEVCVNLKYDVTRIICAVQYYRQEAVNNNILSLCGLMVCGNGGNTPASMVCWVDATKKTRRKRPRKGLNIGHHHSLPTIPMSIHGRVGDCA